MSTMVLYCWCHSNSASVSFVFYMCRRDINQPRTEFKLISKNKITVVVYQGYWGLGAQGTHASSEKKPRVPEM